MSKARANAWSRGSHDACKRFVGYLNSRFVGEGSTSFCAPLYPTQEKRGHATARAQGQGDWEREARQQADGSPAAACLRAVYKRVFNRIQPVRAQSARSTTSVPQAASQKTAENESLSLTGYEPYRRQLDHCPHTPCALHTWDSFSFHTPNIHTTYINGIFK